MLTPMISAVVALAPTIPVMLVWVVGIVVALTQLGARPRAAGFALVGLGGTLVTHLVMVPVQVLLPAYFASTGELDQLSMVFGVISVVSSLLHAVWWGLVVAAVFVGESGPTPAEAARA